ncbi:membrane-bound lytic murein transglycosylase MltF [Maricaulis sp.]|uniref:membrane-bound lytic murein transglycosylase MltF n=1 Tax=Maricaulis sp. TaxID=1486257 RepID=UPI00261222BD|nr:membrane-bound lytic murein transglycosylase MltF [Maricaulis sp.]
MSKALALAGLSLALVQCGPQPSQAPIEQTQAQTRISSLEELLIGGRLVVLTLDGPTIHATDADTSAPTGYEVDLVRAFAIDLGVSVQYEVMPDIDSLLAALDAGDGHVAAANLTVTDERARKYDFGPAYRTVREQLVCNDSGPVPTRLDRLAEARIVVLEGSSYRGTLEDHARRLGGLEWTEANGGSAMPLLEQVQADAFDCTIADSHLADFARRRLPDIVVGLDLSEEQSLAWAYDSSIDGLGDALDTWFAGAHATGFLEELDERWFGRFGDFDYVDVAEFINRVETRLPEYEALFRLAADDSPFEWELIAAQAYQESHWDPDAISATGVEGLMMLTLSTAERVGIADRTDPRQSIEGGVTYLTDLYGRVPDSVTGQDRLWFALAAYNVGMGHMYDTRALAERLGRDKNSWADLEATLPLLSDPDYYPSLRYGYARGYEPVAYVQKVREYRALLEAQRL